MADPNRTVLTESDITDPGPLRTALNNSAGAGPVKSVNGKTGDVTLSASDIDAPDNAQVSGSYFDLSGVSTPFGPGEAESIGTAVNKVSSSLGIINLQFMTKADKGHTHTLEEIGAFSKFGPTYTGHVNDLRDPGTYRISGSSMNASNGYPWTPDVTGYVIVHGYSTAYVTQEVISETGTVWRRNSVAGSTTAWRDWAPVAVDTGWRSIPLENGWTGNLYLRWRNGYVTITVSNLNGSAAANSNLCVNIGSNNAFYAGTGKPVSGIGNTGSSAAAPSGSDVGSIGMTGGTFNSILRASAPNAAWTNGHASVTFPSMNNILPQDLPGTPA